MTGEVVRVSVFDYIDYLQNLRRVTQVAIKDIHTHYISLEKATMVSSLKCWYMVVRQIYMDQRLQREAKIWHSLSHENLVPLFGLCDGLALGPAMISPLYDNGDVIYYLTQNPEANRLQIVSSYYFSKE